jgi:penicillin G amidase
MFELSFDKDGCPGIWAENTLGAYTGLGWLHGRYRPIQSALLHRAGQGRLTSDLWPLASLESIDRAVHRLDLPALARAQVEQFTDEERLCLDHYFEGFQSGTKESSRASLFEAMCGDAFVLNYSTTLAAFMFSSYRGLAQGQRRMERALVEALRQGADPDWTAKLFGDALKTWDPQRYATLPEFDFDDEDGLPASWGGSNAWAVAGTHSASGAPILCGDPHLDLNQLPALFFEARLRVGNNYWLGATLPGLPGVAVGRNRHIAWSGTFAVHDNSDWFIETITDGCTGRDGQKRRVIKERRSIHRRFGAEGHIDILKTERGHKIGWDEGEVLVSAWSGGRRAGHSLGAWLKLPQCESALEAEQTLRKSDTLSLHFLVADRQGEIRRFQMGSVPKRVSMGSGLHPAPSHQGAWAGFITGSELPGECQREGWLVSANESRRGYDGEVLSSFPQPEYRLRQIENLLSQHRFHTVETMQEIQLDLFSAQAKRLSPILLGYLGRRSGFEKLGNWNCDYTPDSHSAVMFEHLYRRALRSLSTKLGGKWFERMLDKSELSLWWMRVLDKALSDPDMMKPCLDAFRENMSESIDPNLRLEDIQTIAYQHWVWGDVGKLLGANRGPYALAGSRASVCQATVIGQGKMKKVIGPAYRFVADLGEEGAYSALPGGIDGASWSLSYDKWLKEYQDGTYHRLMPPSREESFR